MAGYFGGRFAKGDCIHPCHPGKEKVIVCITAGTLLCSFKLRCHCHDLRSVMRYGNLRLSNRGLSQIIVETTVTSRSSSTFICCNHCYKIVHIRKS